MANSYYNNSLLDGDTMGASTLEAIETGFGLVETDLGDKADKVVPAAAGDLAALDAGGNLTDSGKTPPTGEIVGTTDSQPLSNKTIDAANNTISLTTGSVDAITEIAAAIRTGSDAKVVTGTAGVNGDLVKWDVNGDAVDGPTPPAGTIVGTTDSQALSNKSIDANNNTISNLAHGAEVDNPSSGVHGVVGSVVGTTDAQVLSAKTLNSPVINSPSLGANSVDAITEISATIKTGSDAKLVTGTAGTNGDLAKWDVNGDLVDGPTPPSGAIVGTTDTQTLSAKTLTTPKIAQINDVNDNPVLVLSPAASAINRLVIANTSTANVPISAEGASSNININILPKGTGKVYADGIEVVTTSTAQTLTNKTITSITTSGAGLTMSDAPAFRAHVTTNNNQNLPVSSPTKVEFGTEDFDQGSDYNNTTSVFTAPVAGIYMVDAQIRTGVDPTDPTGSHQIRIVKNSSTIVLQYNSGDNANHPMYFMPVSGIIQLAQSDTLEVQYVHPKGGTTAILDDSNTHCTYFSAVKVA